VTKKNPPPGGNKSKESAERGTGSAIRHPAGRRSNEKPRARFACHEWTMLAFDLQGSGGSLARAGLNR
jgi:hypothetical protein